MDVRRVVRRLLLVLVPMAAGVGLAVWLVANPDRADRVESEEQTRPVDVITASEIAYVPSAVGYGEARPVTTWRAIAEVSGEIVEAHDNLRSGAILPRKTLLLRIDPTDYELAIAQSRAAIAAKRAQIAELNEREASTRRLLEIERRGLEIAQRELQRQRTLLERGTVSQSVVDRQEREFIQHRRAVQELENTLALIPNERARLAAELDRERSGLRQAERDLARTEVRAPIDLRVRQVSAEIGQVVRAGETLADGDGIAATEVEAEIPLSRFRPLLDPDRMPEAASSGELAQVLAAMGLTAQVRLRTAGSPVQWRARVDRISETIDVRTRTVGVIVVVDQPYRSARPPEQPPLVRGMYVEIRVCAPPRPPAVVVPRAALHEGRLYIVDDDDRLVLREVEVAYARDGFAVIESGISAGERVVLSDVVPAVAGMKLSPRTNSEAARRLDAEARGEGVCP